MNSHIVIDLETLSLAPDGVILSIGARAFLLDGSMHICEGFERGVTLESQRGRHIDTSVLDWWLFQSEDARRSLHRVLLSAVPLRLALLDLSTWVKEYTDQCIWCNKLNFDVAIIEQAYAAEGIERPWHYRAVRDYHTMMKEFGCDEDKYTPPLAHDALEDATAHARTLQRLYRRLGKVA